MLDNIRQEMLVLEEARNGKLTIFFGYCAGVGKTFSMLNTAHQKSVEGVDVVIGYIEVMIDRYAEPNIWIRKNTD